jgi:hypothetical protein
MNKKYNQLKSRIADFLKLPVMTCIGLFGVTKYKKNKFLHIEIVDRFFDKVVLVEPEVYNMEWLKEACSLKMFCLTSSEKQDLKYTINTISDLYRDFFWSRTKNINGQIELHFNSTAFEDKIVREILTMKKPYLSFLQFRP